MSEGESHAYSNKQNVKLIHFLCKICAVRGSPFFTNSGDDATDGNVYSSATSNDE